MQVGGLQEAVVDLAIVEEGVGVEAEDEAEASALEEEEAEDGVPIPILHGQAALGVGAVNMPGSLGMRVALWCSICAII